MSNTKRNWRGFAIEHDNSDVRFIRAMAKVSAFELEVLCDWAESIVRRELAGEVEKMLGSYANDNLVFRADVLALLSPHQNDAEKTE